MSSPPPSRFEWIDLLRGLAVVGMIWTHAANTFLATGEQATAFFRELNYYHGLVAPTFFWLAGYMRGVSSVRPGTPKPAWPTVKRLLVIWLWGYLLHVPWWQLAQGDFSPPVLRILFQSDVLHCLAVSCLLLLAVERGFYGRPVRPWMVAAVLGAAAVLFTDCMATATTGLMPLDAYLATAHGSLFPLFPWIGFACAGFISGSHGLPGWRSFALGAVVALAVPHIPGASGTAQFFLERLGWVLMAAAVVANAGAWLARVPRWLMLAGRESLVAYVVHLLLIYAVPVWGGRPLSLLIGPTQGWSGVWLWFAVVLGLSLGAAWLNEGHKRRRAGS